MSRKNTFYMLFTFVFFSLLISACGIIDTQLPEVSPEVLPTEAIETISVTVTPTVFATPTQQPTQTVAPTKMPGNTPTLRSTDEPIKEGVLKGLKICIDPGHQSKGNYEKELCAPWDESLKSKCTSGTDGLFTGVEEYVINLQISERIFNNLSALGAEVLMTRTTHNVDISNIERAEIANEFGADITIRIHCNSADSNSAEGIDLFVRGDGDSSAEYKAQSDIDYKEATELLDYLCRATGAKKRYVHKSDSYTGINWCKGTCIIVECGFLSNEKEEKLLSSAEYQEKIAQGITDYFVSRQ